MTRVLRAVLYMAVLAVSVIAGGDDKEAPKELVQCTVRPSLYQVTLHEHLEIDVTITNVSPRDLTLFNARLDRKIGMPVDVVLTSVDGGVIGSLLDTQFRSFRVPSDRDWQVVPAGKSVDAKIFVQLGTLQGRGKSLNFRRGDFRVQVTVKDRIFWKNPWIGEPDLEEPRRPFLSDDATLISRRLRFLGKHPQPKLDAVVAKAESFQIYLDN